MATKRFYVVIAALMLSLAMFAGCGKKGHLVLPESSRPPLSDDKNVPATEPEKEGPSLPSAPATP